MYVLLSSSLKSPPAKGRLLVFFFVTGLCLLSQASAWGLRTPLRSYVSRDCSLTALRASGSDQNPPVQGITLKIALDSTGAVADLAAEASERFTCDESLDMAHRLRCQSDAVLVGRGTVVKDNPSLTVRRVPCDRPQPLRVVVDPRLSLLLGRMNDAKSYQLLEDGLPTAVYHCVSDVDESSLNLMEGVNLIYLPPAKSIDEDLRAGEYLSNSGLLSDLSERFKIGHLMVEGGPLTTRLFLAHKLIDRALIVKAPICFKEPLHSGLSDELFEGAGLQKLGTRTSGVDTIEYWSRADLPWPADQLSSWP